VSGPAAENKPDDRCSSSSPATAFPDNTVNEGESDTTDYYVRHLWDGKASAAIEDTGPKALARYARLCGAVFARAHARSGDATAISGYLEPTVEHLLEPSGALNRRNK
jgi:Uncharacterized protein conserved in bacteria (DUF2252)